MAHPYYSPPALNRIEAALEASCGALVTLESSGTGAGDWTREADGVQAHVCRAVRALREAIEELRQAQSSHASGLAMGFVLNGNGHVTHSELDVDQSRPRRTA